MRHRSTNGAMIKNANYCEKKAFESKSEKTVERNQMIHLPKICSKIIMIWSAIY